MTLEQLQKRYARHGLSRVFETLRPFARSAVRIFPKAQADDSIPVGASKYGGCPDLPAVVDWPRHAVTHAPLSFIGQFRLAQVSPLDTARELPSRGMLYLFYDCSDDGMPWGFDPSDAGGWQVLFFDTDEGLVRRDPPADLEDNGMRFGSAALTMAATCELPDLDSIHGESLTLSDEEEDGYSDMLDEDDEDVCHKLLGHANPIQNPMEEECDLVTRGLYLGDPSGYAEAEARGIHADPSRWVLLMQIDSCDELGMMWGDLGRLYLWMKKEDLAARRFERTWLILQCG